MDVDCMAVWLCGCGWCGGIPCRTHPGHLTSTLSKSPPRMWEGWSRPWLRKTRRLRRQSGELRERRAREEERMAEVEELGAEGEEHPLLLPTPPSWRPRKRSWAQVTFSSVLSFVFLCDFFFVRIISSRDRPGRRVKRSLQRAACGLTEVGRTVNGDGLYIISPWSDRVACDQ